MNVTITGKLQTIATDSSVTAMLSELGFSGKPVVVEINRVALFPREYDEKIIEESAVIEIVTLAAGG
jgi:sulfur carrier protein